VILHALIRLVDDVGVACLVGTYHSSSNILLLPLHLLFSFRAISATVVDCNFFLLYLADFTSPLGPRSTKDSSPIGFP